MNRKVLKVHPDDNVLVAISNLHPSETVQYLDQAYHVLSEVPAKHKMATRDLGVGDPVYMYGVIVGEAIQAIRAGEVISTVNIKHDTHEIIEETKPYRWVKPKVSKWKSRTFLGYHRADGKVGTSNYWLVAPLVFCENRNIEVIRDSMLNQLGYPDLKSQAMDIRPLISAFQEVNVTIEDIQLSRVGRSRQHQVFPNVDGIKFLTHNLGCGGTRRDARELCELIAGYISNPNVAGATILGLGCQNAEQRLLEEAIARRDPKRTKSVFFHEQQQSASEEEFIAEVIKSTFVGMLEANKVSRSPSPLSKLVVGLECGGSDGFSGISANPALGYASDILNTLGGATVLAEFPELNGIEQELMHRCENEVLAGKFYRLMEDYAKKAEMLGSGFEANPSPGNIKDGLITDAIKSAGAAKKGGTAPIVDVLDYTEPVTNYGLNLLCTPGGDVESTTALAGSGANIIVFTTGFGTPTGNPIAPVIKVSSNTRLYEKMQDLIDLDAGPIIGGDSSVEEVGEQILEYIIQVASGKVQTKAQQLGQDDFIPWKRDISL
jgi:altronate hydrolase